MNVDAEDFHTLAQRRTWRRNTDTAPTATHDTLADQMAEFLRRGGRVDVIPFGVSALTDDGKKKTAAQLLAESKRQSFLASQRRRRARRGHA